MLKAQSASLPFGFFAVAEFLLFAAVWGFEPIKIAGDILLPWYFFPIFIIGIILHELIHGLAWMFAGKLSFKEMKFGFQAKTLTPYAHCTVPVKKSAYVFGTVLPAIVLGFVPFFISIANGNGWVLLFGVLFTFVAVGDFLIIRLIRTVPWNAMVEDHPENAGCFVYTNETEESEQK